MIDENERQNLTVIGDLLRKAGFGNGLMIVPMDADGSSRKFWRIIDKNKSICLAVAPPGSGEKDLAEARAARAIGHHLQQQGVRVPEQYGWDETHGVLLFEDLGDRKLHGAVLDARQREKKNFLAAILPWYQQIVEGLAVMQVRGAVSFDPAWCWDTPQYDRTLMLERESGYFLRSFWQDLLGMEEPPGLQAEFVELAERASRIAGGYFLHRDFQSRNIMLHGDEAFFIDFQGGRLGPLAYDLASLLIDPYTGLPEDFQEKIKEIYLDSLEGLIAVDRKEFRENYLLLALQRNLQIIGAFSFLSQQRKKPFFQQFLLPALLSLDKLLASELVSDFPVLRKTARRSLTIYQH